MADQDSPWKGLPPAPPGVPDQSPKPSGSPPTRRPPDDPWARPSGWQPPRPRRRNAGGTPPGSPSPLRKLALGFGAFLVLSTCIRSAGNVFPDLDEPDVEPAPPAAGPAPSDGSTVVRAFRVARDGPAEGSPPGWFRYVAEDGSFSMIGPGRPDQDVSPRAGRSTFRAPGVVLVAEVEMMRAGSRRPRSALDRETAIFLDDLGALEQARRWTGFGEDLRLDVDARRGDTRFRIVTFVTQRRLFRASAAWDGQPDPALTATVEAFVGGLAPTSDA